MTTFKEHALLFDENNAIILKNKDFGKNRIEPLLLTDGTYVVRADILNEIGEDGLYPHALDNIEYEQVLWATIEDLIPTPDITDL